MAPTVCVPEMSAPVQEKSGETSSYNIRRTRQRMENVAKDQRQRLKLKKIFNTQGNDDAGNPVENNQEIWNPRKSLLEKKSDTGNSASDSHSNNNVSERWRSIFARREGLLDILARTMALVRRNHILQKRVNALRFETKEFIRSVMSNPENNSKQDNQSCIETVVSSSSEVLLSRPTPPTTPDSSTNEFLTNNTDNHLSPSLSSASDASPYSYCYSYSSYSPVSSPESHLDACSDYLSDEDYNSAQKLTQDPRVSSS